MAKREEITKTTALVSALLEEEELARNDDVYLIERVYNTILEPYGLHIDLSFIQEFNLPKFDTITRTRRLVQAERPELNASAVVLNGRLNNEEEFREVIREYGTK